MNRLATETSPYLRQHADNPVEWYPWGAEAFGAAAERDVPILLSVGYSSCHWCHVMAHESFEDPATAEVMNTNFVCVKVDREELPDVDAVYMAAVQAINGSGGWPMTLFLLPDQRPFFAGTYFPRATFVDLMGRVTAAWSSNRAALEHDAEAITKAVRDSSSLPSSSQAPPADPSLDHAVAGVLANLDQEWGGFSRAPKFFQPAMLQLLLYRMAAGRREDGLSAGSGAAVELTLRAMARGGVYDHLGGGFSRYSTDRQWLVPHFEKMLYDNALLASTYLRAWQLTGNGEHLQVCTETLDYLLAAPVRLSGGGMCSAEDADSEGVEGRFYLWSAEEAGAVGGAATASWYGVSEHGNWEGSNILFRPLQGTLQRPEEVEAGRRALLERRAGRVRPGLDDKVVTEWNAMAVAALADAGRALGDDRYLRAAIETAEFLLDQLRVQRRWLRSWHPGLGDGPGQARTSAARTGEAGTGETSTNHAGSSGRALGCASDYAWLCEAMLSLYQATGQQRWLGEAVEVAEAMLRLFVDPADGLLYQTGSDAPSLITNPKETIDGATPSANSVAAWALLRLGALTGTPELTAAATRIVGAIHQLAATHPTAFPLLAMVGAVSERGVTELVITGSQPDLVAAAFSSYRPWVVTAWGEPGSGPLWEGRTGHDSAGQAFVCRDYACKAPTSDPAQLSRSLDR